MELTSEEKQRIEDEERRRISEDQYRAKIREQLQAESGRVASVRASRAPWIAAFAVVAAIGGLVAWSVTRGTDTKPKRVAEATTTELKKPSPVPVLKTRYLPVAQNIAKGEIVIGPGGYFQYQFTISPDMLRPVFAGDFTAFGGGGNDIMAVVADEDNYTNWINGHQARVFWGTQGRETTGQFEVHLPPGTYHLAFSNKFSLLARKQISVTAYLNYQKAETYYENPSAADLCPVPPCTSNRPASTPEASNQ